MSATVKYVRFFLFLSYFLFLIDINIFAQDKQQVKQQAETQLQTMTPQQIDAKIKESGMTREQAEAKAREYGVDLNTYMQQKGTSPTGLVPSSQTKTDAPAKKDEGVTEKESKTTTESKATVIGAGGLPYFGYDVFSQTPSAFTPSPTGPADQDYLIGSGDVLRVSLWGRVELQSELEVDNEGRIFIPTVGPILVSGLTLEKSYKVLLKQMSRSYAGLVSEPPTINLDVSIARLRPKRVFIMGEVANPGGYTVNSYATIFNTLYSVGGPTIKGSLRDIRLIRGNKVIAQVDLYDYLTGAEKTNDVRVQNNDIIFVPVRGKTISLKGEVRRQAIFELLPKENLKRLLEIAGGATSTAYLERIQVDRIVPFNERKKMATERQILDVNFRSIISEQKDYTLSDGDKISIYPILDSRVNVVTIEGSVTRQGTYQLEKVPTLKDIVMKADSLLPDAYLLRADILRTRPDQTMEAIKVNLSNALKGIPSDNLILQQLDRVKIYSIYDIRDKQFVTISGNVRFPGKFAYADSLTLYDFLFKSGGLIDTLARKQTYVGRADLLRLNADGLTKTIYPFDLGALLNGDKSIDRQLLPDDEIIVYEIEVVEQKNKFVEIFGSVRKPGKYNLTNGMTLKDALILSGGYTEDAYTLSAEIARVSIGGSGKDSLSHINVISLPVDLSFDVNKKGSSDGASVFALQHRDQIFIRPNPNFRTQKLVSILGEVKYPGQYALSVYDEKLSDFIARAGGITAGGYASGGRVIRNGERINLDVYKAIEKKDENHDIVLFTGDVVTIPLKPYSVRVGGEVYNPGVLGFVDGDNLHNYIDRAGGLTDSAAHILVTFANGNTYQYNTGWFSGNPKIPDGSTIIVTKIPTPIESKPFDLSGTIKESFALLASALTIIVLVVQLKK